MQIIFLIALQVENTKLITAQLQGVKSGKLTTLSKEPNQFMLTHINLLDHLIPWTESPMKSLPHLLRVHHQQGKVIPHLSILCLESSLLLAVG